MYRYSIVIPMALCILSSCNKFMDVGTPPNQYTDSAVFASEALTQRAWTGMYEEAMKDFNFFNGNITQVCGLVGGELVLSHAAAPEKVFETGNYTSQHRIWTTLWLPPYASIAACNLFLQRLPNAYNIAPTLRSYLQGEAHFMRAFNYFYLVQLFGPVPLITGTDIVANTRAARTAVPVVYAQILQDLEAALTLLPKQHPETTNPILTATRPNYWAACALLARIHLYLGNYALAEQFASAVIDSHQYDPLDNIQQQFVYQSQSTIFQLKPVMPGVNTAEGFLFKHLPKPAYLLSVATSQAFDPNDQRQQHWTLSVRIGNENRLAPYKYRIDTELPRAEYNVVLRIEEQYLVRAEARARQNNTDGAREDLATLRRSAGLSLPADLLNTHQVLLAIVRERQAELFAEWGHRFFDLKRWNQLPAGDVLQTYAHEEWCQRLHRKDKHFLFPLPKTEMDLNANLYQNADY